MVHLSSHYGHSLHLYEEVLLKNMIDRLLALNTWESFSCCFIRCNASLIALKVILILTLLIQQYTLLIQLAFAWRSLVVEHHCLYEMTAVLTLYFFLLAFWCLCHNSSFMDWGKSCHSFDETAWTLAITVSEEKLNICMMKSLLFVTLMFYCF